MKKRILFILHVPPPVHGCSIVGQFIKESKIINESFECRYINLGTSDAIDLIGKKSLKKVRKYIYLLINVMRLLRNFKPDLCYITTTAKGPGMYKDFLIIYLVKLFKIKLVHHFHNKGVATRQHKWFDNMVYRNIFNNSEIILLSKYLYSDIQKYVAQKNVHYCPNGVPILSENKLYQKQKPRDCELMS